MRLSIVIPTKNEADNIAACLGAFRARLDRGVLDCRNAEVHT